MPLVRRSGSGAQWVIGGDASAWGEALDGNSRVLEKYLNACREYSPADGNEDTAYVEGLERIKENLLGSSEGMSSCLVCLESIRPADPAWQCFTGDGSTGGCYVALHLPCIQSWALQQLRTIQRKSQETSELSAAVETRWGCPKCRRLFSVIPSGYTCYCGQKKDPPFDPWNTAHSCGEQCARRSGSCGHQCMLLCHPGPCPPCPRVVDVACHCGRVKKTKRCGRHHYSCGEVCGKQRMTCLHVCHATCHLERCPPCEMVTQVTCRCGAETESLQCCQQGIFKCRKVCGKALGCGIHICQRVCCSGDCGTCPLSGKKTCPCGKVQPPRSQSICGMTVPSCGQTCEKLLSCGVHRCQERCHEGSCSTNCRAIVEKRCMCGKVTRMVSCREAFRCERRCKEMRSCGRHPCKRRCCDGNCSPCEEICGRWLPCRNHKCPAPCHSGPCAPCPLTAKIACACGKTSYSVPCGRESSALPPACQFACPVPAVCRHGDVAKPHRCHFGPCPPCPLPCGTPLLSTAQNIRRNCGHVCSVPKCHDPPPPAVAERTRPPVPIAPGTHKELSTRQLAELQAKPPAVVAAAEAMALAHSNNHHHPASSGFKSECPPCGVLVEQTCLGGHESRQQPCSSTSAYACARPCGRPLTCTHHYCGIVCHDPECQPCAPCALPCTIARPCNHACPKGGPCHPGPCGNCEVVVTKPCFCGQTALEFPCFRVVTSGGGGGVEVNGGTGGGLLPQGVVLKCDKVCSRPLPRCPHTCNLPCHEGQCAGVDGCEAEVTIRCACRRLKKKVLCLEVSALLKAKTIVDGDGEDHGAYDASTSLRLLPCDQECHKRNATEKKRVCGATTAAPPSESPMEEKATSPTRDSKGKRHDRLSLNPVTTLLSAKEERELERVRKEAERNALQRRQHIARLVFFVCLIVCGVLGGMLANRVLLTVDRKAQQAWGLGEL